jgi:hypothetical protein
MPERAHGPRVLGQKEFERQQAAQRAGPYGSRVGGKAFGSRVERPPDAPADTVAAIEAQLAGADDAAADAILDSEGARDGGPRKGVLRAVLSRETAREGGARPAAIEKINGMLA